MLDVTREEIDDLSEYVLHHYPQLLNEQERSALAFYLNRIKTSPYADHRYDAIRLRGGEGHDSAAVETMLGNGIASFYRRARERVLRDYPQAVHINRCPRCSGLAKTPYDKHCPHCVHHWE